ncbi:hypothetical protein DH2020_040286 [Rehmannia glutinosa]|uniref:DUF3741 domain-containing protein n=1 Tax=Rehmannia glutinosa TaxID=99300 RepID=A0ABR0UTE6_REHGL
MAANSADASSSTKCYTAVLRRLLCSGSFPTHPSDQFADSNIEKIGAEKCLKPDENAKQSAKSNPGVVARLMGLDSFPNTPLGPKDKTLGSYFRSREVREITKGKKEMKLKNKESCYYKRMVEIICRLTEEGLEENWMHEVVLKFDDFEEICQLFGQEILEVLVKQFVDELVGLTFWDKGVNKYRL